MLHNTKDYGKFVQLLGNRSLNKNHVKRLIAEIQQKNLLEVCPIIVNERWEIIDGQHRIEAAKALKKEIWYVKVPGLDISNVVHLNRTQRPWKLIDYVDLYIAHGKQDYVDLKEFSLTHNLPISICADLLGGTGFQTSKVGSFRDGKFVITRLEDAEHIVEMMTRLRPVMKTLFIYKEKSFAMALLSALKKLKLVDKDLTDLVEAIENKGFRLELHHMVKEYLRDFEGYLNAGKPMSKLRLF